MNGTEQHEIGWRKFVTRHDSMLLDRNAYMRTSKITMASKAFKAGKSKENLVSHADEI